MSPLLTNAELDTFDRYFRLAVARMAIAEAALVDGDERMVQSIADAFVDMYNAEQEANRESHERQRAAERGNE